MGSSGPRASASLRVDPDLRFLLAPRLRRGKQVPVLVDGTSTVVHVVESVGIPRTEIGSVIRGGAAVALTSRVGPGDAIEVRPPPRPQRGAEHGFLLDVHLGGLARRLRLLGIDAAYRNDADDPELLATAISTRRVLLTQDRGLLRQRALPAGALVRGRGTDEQMLDVLDRFRPPLAAWTRCGACNASLVPVAKEDIVDLLRPGTRASYDSFARCTGCGQLYWRGAHAAALDRIVAAAREAVEEPPD